MTYGLSVGGGSSNFSVSQEHSQGNDTAVNVAAYGIAWVEKLYISGLVSYGHFSTDVNRYNFGAAAGLQIFARSSFDSNIAGGRIELGYQQRVGNMSVTPYAALDLDQSWQSDLVEAPAAGGASGISGVALHYGSVSRLSAPLTLGARLSTSFMIGNNHRFTPYVGLGWVHEFNPARTIDATFLGASASLFQVEGVRPSRDTALANLAGTLGLNQHLSLLASFNGQFSGVETEYGGVAGLQLTW